MGVEYNFPNISSQSLEIVPEPGVFKQKKKWTASEIIFTTWKLPYSNKGKVENYSGNRVIEIEATEENTEKSKLFKETATSTSHCVSDKT